MRTLSVLTAVVLLFVANASFARNPIGNSRGDSLQSNQYHVLLSQYFMLENALAEDNLTDAKIHCKDMIDQIRLTSSDDTASGKQLAQINGLLTEMSSQKKIDGVREGFALVSDQLWKLIQKTNNNAEPIYQAYCPMKKAYWLTASKKIKNPYYGKKMLNFGQITSELSTNP